MTSDDATVGIGHSEVDLRVADVLWAELRRDVERLAEWWQLRGAGSDAVISVVVEPRAPEQLQQLATRVSAHTFSNFAVAGVQRGSLAEIAELVGGLEERELAILRDRYVAWEKSTLEEIGDRFGVTRERVRQIERKLIPRVEDTFRLGTAVGDLVASVRMSIDPVMSLKRLVRLHPVLGQDIPWLGVPLWRVVDQLDQAFVVEDGWAAAPTLNEAKARTDTLFAEVASEAGIARREELVPLIDIADAEFKPWLAYCGYRFEREYVLAPTRSVNDRAAQVLELAGEALDFDELFTRMDLDRNERTVRNALGADDRFTRVAMGTFGLAVWGEAAYTTIADEIAKRVDVHGSYRLEALIAEITALGSAEASVRMYSAYGLFETVNGVVTRRDTPSAPVREPRECSGMFRLDDGWAVLIAINSEHLRGSGFPSPTGLVQVLGLQYGEERLLPSADGDQAVRWRAPQPTIGTIRRLLEADGYRVGDRAHLVFREDGRFELRRVAPVRTDGSHLDRAVSLIGAGPASDEDAAVALLAAAVDNPGEDRPRRLVSAYRVRRDPGVVEELEKHWL